MVRNGISLWPHNHHCCHLVHGMVWMSARGKVSTSIRIRAIRTIRAIGVVSIGIWLMTSQGIRH